MALSLGKEDDPLGKIHEEYNKLVKDALTNKKELNEKEFTSDKRDLDNLMKIDIASHNKDIDYILSVLKSEDMLYVSRAIKQCIWLVDDQYENIINPEYLNNKLFPEMTTKASIKLFKHIRHYLKTESRVEQFYNNETTVKGAAKWLSRCSIPFIESNIQKHMPYLPVLEFKRLCEKSVTIFEIGMNYNKCYRSEALKAASFLLRTHVGKYLDVFEASPRYSRPELGAKATALIMKQTPDRVKNNFLQYVSYIHVPTFVKYIKKEDVKEFIYKLAHTEEEEHYYRAGFSYNIIKHFVRRMPKEEQFEFVKRVFIDEDSIIKVKDESIKPGSEMFAIKRICVTVRSGTPNYYWYVFAPFNVAFNEIKKLIHAETDIYKKYSMLTVLLKCAGDNTKHLLTLLIYYNKNHLTDEIQQKRNFVNSLLSQTEIYKNEDEVWNAFIEIFINMNVYTENDNQEYVEIIILYHVLQNKQVSEVIEKSFSFDTLKKYRSKLNQCEQNKVFGYLYNYIIKKLESFRIQNEEQFNEAIKLLNKLLDLLIDWDKQIIDYPIALNKIRELIKIREDNSWKINLSDLYNKKKSWRRHMFEESITLNPSQDVCVNVLKHDPGLLVRYKKNVEMLCCDDTISLKQLLKKIRIYWPDSLAHSWMESYLERLDKLGGQTALTRGLFNLLPQEPALDIMKKYAPIAAKIDWNNTNELTLGLQRCIAKNMHIARPQPSADTIILYAKGDFLQYALPSLLAIFYNMSRVQSQQNIPKILNAPVSLQKHGLRLAYTKLKHEELKHHLSNVWQTSKNISIRAVTFVLLFDLMCKEKDAARAEELWEILEVFIDNLSFQEDKKIYEKLPKLEQVPDKIKPKFLVKSYKFLKNLLPHLKDNRSFEYSIEQLATYTRNVMEDICPEFVVDLIREFINEKFFDPEVNNLNEGMVRVISSYLLCARDEETQTKKYEDIFAPLLKRSLDRWDEIHNESYFIRRHLQTLLTRFSVDLNEYVINNKMIIPTKMFTNIQIELHKSLDVPQNYLMLTMWKLIVKLTEIIEKNNERDDWLQLCSQIVPDFGKMCLDTLKEDVKLYFSCIYILYAKVLNMVIRDILPDIVSLQIYELILSDKDFIQGFLVILKLLPDRQCYRYSSEGHESKTAEIRNTIREHPSVEVKMHYYSVYKNDIES